MYKCLFNDYNFLSREKGLSGCIGAGSFLLNGKKKAPKTKMDTGYTRLDKWGLS
jgi:hypothetical protein